METKKEFNSKNAIVKNIKLNGEPTKVVSRIVKDGEELPILAINGGGSGGSRTAGTGIEVAVKKLEIPSYGDVLYVSIADIYINVGKYFQIPDEDKDAFSVFVEVGRYNKSSGKKTGGSVESGLVPDIMGNISIKDYTFDEPGQDEFNGITWGITGSIGDGNIYKIVLGDLLMLTTETI